MGNGCKDMIFCKLEQEDESGVALVTITRAGLHRSTNKPLMYGYAVGCRYATLVKLPYEEARW